MNTQACYIYNFSLLNNRNDPGGMLAWLEENFREMEKNNEKAIIIGHVPTGQECMNEFASRYNALIERYQNIVRI